MNESNNVKHVRCTGKIFWKGHPDLDPQNVCLFVKNDVANCYYEAVLEDNKLQKGCYYCQMTNAEAVTIEKGGKIWEKLVFFSEKCEDIPDEGNKVQHPNNSEMSAIATMTQISVIDLDLRQTVSRTINSTDKSSAFDVEEYLLANVVPPLNTLYIVNDANVSENDLILAFAKFGNLKSVKFSKRKRFAFIEFVKTKAAQQAKKQMSGAIIKGKHIFIRSAKTKLKN